MSIYKLKEFNPKYRALEAAKAIKEGDLIMKCQPIAHAVISGMRGRICSYCLKEQEEMLRCSQCKVMFYCDKQCQLKDWKSFHKLECKSYEAISKKKFKITSEFVLLARCYLKLQKDSKIDEDLAKFLDLPEVLSQDLRQYHAEMAAVLLENFQIPKNPETMGKLIRLCGVIGINTFTVQDYLFNHAGIAIGLYSPANFANHSCNPNSVQIFNGKELNIVALRDIQQQEEITISYLDQTLDIKQRKALLRQSYYFECLCFQCLAEKAIQKDLSDLLCEECKQGSLGKNQNKFACNKCNHSFSEEMVNDKKKQVQKLQNTLQKSSSYEQSIKSFYSLRKLLRFSNSFFAKVIQNLYHQALQQAQLKNSDKYFQDAYQLMKSYLYNFPQWYHMTSGQKFHILLLWKYAEMGKLAMHLGKLKKAVEYTQKAMDILKKSRLSADFEEVRDLKRRYQELQLQCKMNATSCRK